jgi:hypothetical protein
MRSHKRIKEQVAAEKRRRLGRPVPTKFAFSNKLCECGKNHYGIVANDIVYCPIALYMFLLRKASARGEDTRIYAAEKPITRLLKRADPERDACDYYQEESE